MAKNLVLTRISLMCLGWALPLLVGCAPVLVAAGAAVGYAASRDSVTVALDHPMEMVWEAVVEEVRLLGKVKREDPKRRRVEGRVEGADVVITLKPLTVSTVRAVVRARQNLLPRPDIAQRIGFGLVRRIEKDHPLL
jgi:hypothetical protein